jgi:hypothetical protein
MFFTRFSFCNPFAVDGGAGVLGALRQRRLAFPIRRTNQPGKTLRHSRFLLMMLQPCFCAAYRAFSSPLELSAARQRFFILVP